MAAAATRVCLVLAILLNKVLLSMSSRVAVGADDARRAPLASGTRQRKQGQPNKARNTGNSNYGYVSEVYTFGAVGAGRLVNQKDETSQCMPGMRIWNQDGARVDPIANLTGLGHLRMSTLVLKSSAAPSYKECTSANGYDLSTTPKITSEGLAWLADIATDLLDGHHLHGIAEYSKRIKAAQMTTGTDGNLVARAIEAVDASDRAYAKSCHHAKLSRPSGWTLVHFHFIRDDGLVFWDTDVVLIMQNKELECVLAFEGTDSYREIFQQFLRVANPPTSYYCGEASGSYYNDHLRRLTEDSQWQDVTTKLGQCTKVSVTGHSLGGALADVFAACQNRLSHQSSNDFQAQTWKQNDPVKIDPMDCNYWDSLVHNLGRDAS